MDDTNELILRTLNGLCVDVETVKKALKGDSNGIAGIEVEVNEIKTVLAGDKYGNRGLVERTISLEKQVGVLKYVYTVVAAAIAFGFNKLIDIIYK